MAIPELTAADKVLMCEITALHAQRQATTSQAEKDAIRQQIMEKQQLISTHTPASLASAPSTVIEPSDARNDTLLQQISNLTYRMVSLLSTISKPLILRSMLDTCSEYVGLCGDLEVA